jgi:hypothetical protein
MQRTVPLAPPTFTSVGERLFAGLAAQRGMGDGVEIPAQWKVFMSGPNSTFDPRTGTGGVTVWIPLA